MKKQDAKKPSMHEFSVTGGWREIEDFIEYGDAGSVEEAYNKKGFSMSDKLGAAMGWSFLVYENDSGRIRFLVDVSTLQTWYPVAIPTMPDFLEFMRLYLPVVEAMQRFSDRGADEVEEEIRRLRMFSRAVQPKV